MNPAEKRDEDSVPTSERPTIPDIAPFDVKAARTKIERLPKLPRRKEVIYRICEADSLQPEKVKNLRMASSGRRDTLIEHRCHETGTTYLYVTKEYDQVPAFYSFNHKLVSLSHHPDATVLLRIDWFETVTEIHRWEEDEDE